MDKIARIRQEIGRLKRLLNDSNCYLDNSEQAVGYENALDDLNEFIGNLSEEPDKSLEEAAEEYFYRNWSDGSLDIKPQVKEDFKAGAEWQKKQMMKDAVEGEAEELYNDGESQCTVGVGTYFKPGEKVYILKAEEEQR